MTAVVLRAGHGAAYVMDTGDRARIVNAHGTQVVDCWARALDDPNEHLSMEHTRTSLERLRPRPGDTLLTNRRLPLLRFESDTSPGMHDTLVAACDQQRYRQLGVLDPHRSCADNFRAALADLGQPAELVPAPLNLFMNVNWSRDGQLRWDPPLSEAGDEVVLEALRPAVLVLSACPMDANPTNGGQPQDVNVEILRLASAVETRAPAESVG